MSLAAQVLSWVLRAPEAHSKLRHRAAVVRWRLTTGALLTFTFLAVTVASSTLVPPPLETTDIATDYTAAQRRRPIPFPRVEDFAAKAVDVWSYIGQPLGSQYLANLEVNGDKSYAYSFVARDTAQLERVQLFIAVNTSRVGYSAGTGGTTTFALHRGSPEGPELASTEFTPGLVNGYGPAGDGSSGASRTKNHPINYPTLELPADLVAGETYYIVASNPSRTDYVSINHGFSRRTSRGPVGPSEAEFGLLRNWFDSAGWVEYTSQSSSSRYLPALLIQTNKGNYGNSAADPRDGEDQQVSGSRTVRQQFSLDTPERVTSLSMSTTGGGTVRVTLGGTSVVVDTGGDWQWDTAPFDVDLAAGTHTLLLQPVSGSVTFGVFRYGETGLGERWPQGGSWDGGIAEYNTGSGWNTASGADTDLAGIALATN